MGVPSVAGHSRYRSCVVSVDTGIDIDTLMDSPFVKSFEYNEGNMIEVKVFAPNWTLFKHRCECLGLDPLNKACVWVRSR